ncbi:mediator of DNA damage checkpoint protein 1-like isoform X2 [Cydia fagiglandana]|uniref:mediator of DNA damage checkpoint protein 1-like isoform X2 n=1 Tax=Cydia fagiglandana TaxID=1458189 RepID=UPI002FEDF841
MEIECTQKLECTQEIYNIQIERTDPEQIGFLGIQGATYPIKRGPNKIGRDPQACRIYLNLNSISRQHAVINVLSLSDIMLMDLDSSNKTKVQGKTLQPYIPYPLKNGDMVQFGAIFGMFRLLEDDNDLPMTQAIDLPCTPAPVPKQMSRLGAPVLVPESPEVSDMDDSFVMPSQPKKSSEFKSPMNKFIKPSNKTIAIQPMGSKTIDNAYWASAKKSDSFNFQLDDSGSSFNDSSVSNKSNKIVEESNDNIHEMETQPPFKANDSTDSIYTANTQVASPSVHCMETQPPALDIHMQDTQQAPDIHALDTQNVPDTIHNCDTQAPITDKLPEVRKLDDQKDLQIDLFSANKENENSLDNIFNAETQAFVAEKEPVLVEPNKSENINKSVEESFKIKDDSDEEIAFEELNTQSFHDDFESQPIIPSGKISPPIERIEKIEVSLNKIRRESGSSTDCEDMDIIPNEKLSTDIDMLPTQKIIVDSKSEKIDSDICVLPTQKIVEDIKMLPTQKIVNNDDDDLTDCEDEEELVKNDDKAAKASPEIDFEDMATQIIGDDVIEAEINKTIDQTDGPSKGISFEELPTQIITDDSKEENFEELPTQILTDEGETDKPNEQVYSEEMIISPFKVPSRTPLKTKRTPTKASTPKVIINVDDDDDPNYYAATQDLFNDLCTQREPSPDSIKPNSSNQKEKGDDELVPCSVEGYEMGDRFRHIESEMSPLKKSESGGSDSKLNKITNEKSTSNAVLKTPQTLKIMNIDLPDSQEIKTSVTLKHNSITESSSDTETDEVSDQDSGITHIKKRKPKVHAKRDLSKKLEELPSRIITRVRKPTLKVREALKMADSDDNIDADIVSENISRLKSKTDKKKGKEEEHSKILLDEPTKRPHSRNENKKKDKPTEESASDSKGRSSRSKTKKSEETKSKTDDKDSDDKKVRSTRSTRNKKDNSKDEKSKGKEQKSKEEKKSKSGSESNSRKDSHSRSNSKSRSDPKNRNDSKTRSHSKNRSDSKTRSSRSAKENNKDTSKSKEKTPEEEVRRSSRQKSNKETPKHENSTVYLSSESSTESPKNLKRTATNELEVPSPKRTRSLPNSKSACAASTSVQGAPVRAETQYVLFTAFSNDDVRSKLEKLGAVIVTDVMSCTVLVTLQIKRTFKLLCAVGLGRPIVGPEWVQACADTNTIVDPWLYLIKDSQAERRFQFSLEKTLKGRRNFLEGYHVSSTPSVMPTAPEMKLIVQCSGGVWQPSGANWVCVTSAADRGMWAALRRRGAALVSTEFILGGVLRQRADIEDTAFGYYLPTQYLLVTFEE